ncbi:2-polyprenyl-6-methoxyphenol hydroxylase-like FAD-dependent oxidoreductase [Saccharothrix coeruleofusca]|uniref:FAD-dependent oxidoreductase n=1 Tax=Saccharothrix coeruleofusca TaxID=33919 RepID=UPI0027DBE8A7|nr:NAD(P)/FAD-dependent oxidoreductase [Saccharothrix coeruleofusca]MBP2335600.1 2-polyprenyl-6-methoxyphenol hydroxylase-like FAD-dependent oxidoreductase [Saccharothrix coeruleofusca]
MSTDVDVVVSGAGVAGLAAAHALGGLGLRVLVLDKQREIRAVPKGELLQPGATNVLADWGVADGLAADGALRLSALVARDARGAPLMTMDYRVLPTERPWLLVHDYHVILAALARALPASVELRRGVVVRELVRDEHGRAAGVRTDGGDVTAGLVVAADGVSSRLRRDAGIGIERTDYPHRLAAFELTGQPLTEDVSTYATSRGLAMRYSLPGGRARLYVQVGPDELRRVGVDAAAGWVDGLVRDVPAFASLREDVVRAWPTRQVLPVSRALSASLTADELVLIGESAHAVHPAAGQGMNSSIVDAASLGARLRALDGDLSPELLGPRLRAWSAERRRALVHVGTTSHNATRMITDLSPFGRAIGRRALRKTGGNRRLSYTIMHNMAGLGQHPLKPLDRLHQLGVLPDPRGGRLPGWAR